jgi:hypothetical protein
MRHMLATSRIISRQAALVAAVLALVVAAALSVVDHSPFPHAQLSPHHYHHASGVEGMDAREELVHHVATHPDMAHCCHEDGVNADCPSVCAAMAGCPMQITLGEGIIVFTANDSGPFCGKPVFHAAISISPSTPPPKAPV